MRKRSDTLQDQVVQREGDYKQAKDDLDRMQQKLKTFMHLSKDSSNYPRGVGDSTAALDSVRSELKQEKETNEELRANIEFLERLNQDLQDSS